jgi:hypothetical protein
MVIPKRAITNAQLVAAIKTLTPAQLAQLAVYIALRDRADRDSLITELRQLVGAPAGG